MRDTAIAIFDSHRIMSISTVRPDGWPQATIVGYANDGLTLYFVIFRSSQKFANIAADERVAVCVGDEPPDIRLAKAVYAGARAAEVTDASEQDAAWRLLSRRHPNLVGAPRPDPATTALMRARCEHLSVLDYGKGLGHADALHVGGEGGPPADNG